MRRTVARGYGGAHQKLRRRWAPKVARGEVHCAHPKCRCWIRPGEPWDLGHNPLAPGSYLGPMHRGCNRDTTWEKSLRRPCVARPPAESWL
jgi:hypothetical protein